MVISSPVVDAADVDDDDVDDDFDARCCRRSEDVSAALREGKLPAGARLRICFCEAEPCGGWKAGWGDADAWKCGCSFVLVIGWSDRRRGVRCMILVLMVIEG